MMSSGEILVIPFYDVGHVFPATELALRLASRGLPVTLFLPTSSPAPPSLHPRIKIVPLPRPPLHDWTNPTIEHYILSPSNSLSFAVVDVMMGHLSDPLLRRGVPFVALFTSSACSAALEHAARPFRRPDRDRSIVDAIPGIPEEMAITPAYFLRRPRHPPPPSGPPPPGSPPGPPPPGPPPGPPPPGPPGRRARHGLDAVDGASALAFSTCDDLERPFLEYVSVKTGKRAWGVGPLLPAGFASPPDITESSDGERGELMRWLDEQPSRSVLYVCFGTRVGPREGGTRELTAALGESARRFVWVVRDPQEEEGEWIEELERRAGWRGVVVRGWAPQKAILSHGATGGFLTHCGWNSTVEALGCGVPMLTWPMAGDQIHNARLVTRWLRVGRELEVGEGGEVTREELVRGIEGVMGDEGMRATADDVRARLGFHVGVPRSSEGAMDALCNLLLSGNGNGKGKGKGKPPEGNLMIDG